MKKFLKITWTKIILTILLFIAHPEPVLSLGTVSKSWKWFAGIDIIRNSGEIFLKPFKWIGTEYFIGEFFSSLGKILLLLVILFVLYIISSFIIWIVEKVKK